MFKNMRLVIPIDMFLNPSFKMTSFANIARTTSIDLHLDLQLLIYCFHYLYANYQHLLLS